MRPFFAVLALGLAQPALANDWEKHYYPSGGTTLISSSVAPEVFPSTGNTEQDQITMWRRGFAVIGYSSFRITNAIAGKGAVLVGGASLGDALKFAKRLQARYVIMSEKLVSSSQISVPTSTLPTTTYTNGTASAYGSGGYVSGSYNDTTTTSNNYTTYVPMTVNTFDRLAAFYNEAPKVGIGTLTRDLSPEEVARFETQRGMGVLAVREGSPAYNADVLPGDIIITVNGQPADYPAWQAAIRGAQPLSVHMIRNGKPKDLKINIPVDWKPK